jgi:tryptophanyl-tRNA synthetase
MTLERMVVQNKFMKKQEEYKAFKDIIDVTKTTEEDEEKRKQRELEKELASKLSTGFESFEAELIKEGKKMEEKESVQNCVLFFYIM